MAAVSVLRGYVAFVAFAGLAAACSGRSAVAEQMFVDLPPTILTSPGETAVLDVRVGPRDQLPRQAFLRLRGLPAGVVVKGGHLVAPGVWAVPLFALAQLRMSMPANGNGKADVSAALVDVDGRTLAEARARVITAHVNVRATIEAELAVPALANALAPLPAPLPVPAGRPDRTRPPVGSAASSPDAKRLELEQLLADGDRALVAGDVAFARQIYRHVAGKGSALAAFKLAETFDSTAIARNPAAADASEASHWYRRAEELGERRAAARLQRLGARD
jgi:hypothetical protein